MDCSLFDAGRWQMKKIIHDVGGWFGYSGAGVSAFAYGGYAVHLLKEGSETNIVTWVVWSAEAILSFFIQKDQSNDDPPKYVEELVAAIGCIGITVLLLWKGAVQGVNLLGPVDLVRDGVSVVACLIVYRLFRASEKTFHDTRAAALFFQVVILFGALPLVRSTSLDSSGEDVIFWALWTAGFALQTLCTLMRQDEKGLWPVLTPLNYLFWHALIAGIVAGFISIPAVW